VSKAQLFHVEQLRGALRGLGTIRFIPVYVFDFIIDKGLIGFLGCLGSWDIRWDIPTWICDVS